MRKFFVDSGGINLSVNDYGGQGPPVVLLHGVMGRAACWWPVIPGLVTAGFHVFAFDQRGHGHSGRGQPYTVEQLAADTRAVLEQAVSGPAFMIGHSLGGIVALVATATWPHLTRALVIEDIAAHGAAHQLAYLGAVVSELARTFSFNATGARVLPGRTGWPGRLFSGGVHGPRGWLPPSVSLRGRADHPWLSGQPGLLARSRGCYLPGTRPSG